MIYFNGTKLLDESDKQPNWNLLTGTSNFDGFKNIDNVQNTQDFYGNYQTRIATPWLSPIKLIQVFTGQVICFSAVVQAMNTANLPKLGIYGGDTKAGGTAKIPNTSTINNSIFVNKKEIQMANGYIPSDTEPHVLTGFFKITQGGLFNPRVECMNEASWLVSSYKVETGTVRTDWTPAIQDLTMKSNFEMLKSKVDQLTKNQNGGVTSLLSHIRHVTSNRMEAA